MADSILWAFMFMALFGAVAIVMLLAACVLTVAALTRMFQSTN